MKRIIATASLSIGLVTLLFATPAMAINGRDALAKCNSQANCRWALGSDGEIIIYFDDGRPTIKCPGGGGECKIANNRPKPAIHGLTSRKGSASF